MVTTIAFLGDSITASGRWQEWFPECVTHNLGVGGDTTSEVISRVDEVIELNPHVVSLLIGTNDVAWRKPASHIVRNTETIVRSLKNDLPHARIILTSVLPRESEFAFVISEVNKGLSELSTVLHCEYLDMSVMLSDSNGGLKQNFSEDSLHLSSAGYELWKNEFRGQLNQLEQLNRLSHFSRLPVF